MNKLFSSEPIANPLSPQEEPSSKAEYDELREHHQDLVNDFSEVMDLGIEFDEALGVYRNVRAEKAEALLAAPKVVDSKDKQDANAENGISKIFGTWPGDETEEQLLGALDEIRKPKVEEQDGDQELPLMNVTPEEKKLARSKVVALFGNFMDDVKRELINAEADLFCRERQLRQALRENRTAKSVDFPSPKCDVCCGDGVAVGGRPCICGGSGLSDDEKIGLRRAVIELEEKLDSLSPQISSAIFDALSLLKACKDWPVDDVETAWQQAVEKNIKSLTLAQKLLTSDSLSPSEPTREKLMADLRDCDEHIKYAYDALGSQANRSIYLFDHIRKLREELLAKGPLSEGTGVGLVRQERLRQIEQGWTPAHDDSHTRFELAKAAESYLVAAWAQLQQLDWNWLEYEAGRRWPWGINAMPELNPDPVRNLVKSAALIVAEIERLQRATDGPGVRTVEPGK